MIVLKEFEIEGFKILFLGIFFGWNLCFMVGRRFFKYNNVDVIDNLKFASFRNNVGVSLKMDRVGTLGMIRKTKGPDKLTLLKFV